MFYSQFILAKKGPLGTIWIAAHLERKLRKNQVADTNIGDSVDSILCPDVPIALRLSSHLLLGVVRIYSRKVNYLFDDCSEALLKIKQAFRSAAVDLPPEQSKAPYHSITLPETFDLDDFELPDNEIFQGNYVDHHVSSREQITLQDTMDGVAYSTSRFGLDERFGDADTSGLDLDEELFLEKVGTSGHDGLSTDPQASFQPAVIKQEDQHEGMNAISEPMIDGDDDDIHFMDDAQAPRTPGLVEEPNLCNAQETSACEDHFESEDHHLTESAVKVPDDKISHSDVHKLSENGYHPADLDNKQLKAHKISLSAEVTVEHLSPDDHAPASEPSSHLDKVPHLQEHINDVDTGKASVCPVHESVEDYGKPDESNLEKVAQDISGSANTCLQAPEAVLENNHASSVVEVSDNRETAGTLDESRFASNALEVDKDSQARPCNEQAEGQACQKEKEYKVLSSDAHVQILRPCNANLDQLDPSNPDTYQSVDPVLSNENANLGPMEVSAREETEHTSETSTIAQGEVSNVVDVSEKIPTEYNVRNGASGECILSGFGKSNDAVDNGISGGSPMENVNSSAGPDLPAPEKLMSLTEGADNLPRNLLVESTPRDLLRNDDGDAGSNVISGKKRSYTESTLTEQSLNSVQSSRIVRSKRSVENIPDDDDLLSSILVGRRSSALKVKPTPLPWDTPSVKRTQSVPRASSIKRKVLMDDIMVLHGDTIRQQLIDTEDIRRVRKKAPCTRPEISMIQKLFLEDGIFTEPIYTGMLTELSSLHNQTRDLSGIRISLDDTGCTSLGMATGMIQNEDNNRNVETDNSAGPSLQNISKESEMEGTDKFVTAMENHVGEAGEDPFRDTIKLDEDDTVRLDVDVTQSQIKLDADVEQNTLLLETPGDLGEREADIRSSSIPDGVNMTLPVMESSLHDDQIPGDKVDTSSRMVPLVPTDENPAGLLEIVDDKKSCELDASLHVDAPDTSHDQKPDEISSQMDAVGEEVVEGHDMVGKDCDNSVRLDTEPHSGYGVLLEAADGDAAVETAPDANNTVSHYSSQRFVDKDTEQSVMESSFLLENDMLVEGDLLNAGEHSGRGITHPLNTIDAEMSAVCDLYDLNYSTAGNDTDFLNVDDDDDDVEPTDDYVPNEGARLTENSGWSSRTRAVANYLQTLFDKQTGNGRPLLLMDNLLVGKTRKEASRMFFEALVLKTKDYIHVEQGNPFESIALKPRAKLMKSDF